jgi:hypothetical protein
VSIIAVLDFYYQTVFSISQKDKTINSSLKVVLHLNKNIDKTENCDKKCVHSSKLIMRYL